MLYGYIKFGSVDVPIIDLAHLTGNIGQHPTNAVLTVLRLNYNDHMAYDAGITVAEGILPYYRSGETPPPARTFCYIEGGRTGAGDSSEMVVSIRTTGDDPDNLTYFVNCQVNKQDGETSILLDRSAENMIQYKASAGTTRNEIQTTRLFAIKYNYPEQSEPKLQRYGYFIGIVTKNHYVYPNGNETENYTISTNGWWLPIPYINSRGHDLNYEEIPPEPEPPEEPFDPSEPEPYDPHGDDTSDDINVPLDPPIGLTNVGFINVYKTSINALAGLGEYIFPDPQALTATDVLTALIKICQTLTDVNLINYVIDCHIIPYTPHTSGQANIKVGYRDTGISADVVDQDYVTVACGSLNIGEYFSGFQDYLLTKSKLYLPFIGFVDMKPEFWQAGTLTVDYKFNVIDGSFMCYIRSTSSKSQLHASVIAQYAGNACYHIPITGMSYAQLAAGFVGAGASIASSGGSVANVLGSATSALNTMASSKDMQQSNGYSASAAMMGIRKPYLMIERPKPAYPANYAHDKGYPSNITTALSNVHGFTVISDIDLSGIPLTDSELNDIRALLSEGVYF